jgi:uncharacterized protein YeaO (DUF488 family)
VLVQVWLVIARYPDRMGATSRIRLARVYDDPNPDDGRRILVDRLWPRGFRKDDPRVGTWFKDVAPSKELREWYNHQPERFDEFAAMPRSWPHFSASNQCFDLRSGSGHKLSHGQIVRRIPRMSNSSNKYSGYAV